MYLVEIGYLYIGIAVILAIIAFIMTDVSYAGTFWLIVVVAGAVGYFFDMFDRVTSVEFTRYAICTGGAILGWFIGGLANAAERVGKAQKKFDRWLDEK